MFDTIANFFHVSTSTVTASIIFVLLIFVAVIWTKINEKKGINSLEKQQLMDLAAKLIPQGSNCATVYASHMTVHYYTCFAVSIHSQVCYVIPISYDNGRITHNHPMRFDASNLGQVNVQHRSFNTTFVTFFSKDQKVIVEFTVVGSNTKNPRTCKVNIQQKKELEAFNGFLALFEEHINITNDVLLHR